MSWNCDSVQNSLSVNSQVWTGCQIKQHHVQQHIFIHPEAEQVRTIKVQFLFTPTPRHSYGLKPPPGLFSHNPVYQREVRGSVLGVLSQAALLVLPGPLLRGARLRRGLWRGGGRRRGGRGGRRLPGPRGRGGSRPASEGAHGVGGGQGGGAGPLGRRPATVKGSAAGEGGVRPGVVLHVWVASGCPWRAPGVVGVQVVKRLTSAKPTNGTPTLAG